jgi:sigma-B regulation protein RsbU (phosphoserine phosphatase)
MGMRERERRLRVLAFLVLLVLGGYQMVVSWEFADQIRNAGQEVKDGLVLGRPWPTVRRASERARAAGLRDGDRLLEVQGQRYTGEAARVGMLEKYFPGDRYRVTVAGEDGVRREVSWQLESSSEGGMAVSRVLFLGLMTVAMPYLCLLVGFWVVMARPTDGQAWLLLGMLVSFSHVLVHPTVFEGPQPWTAILFELHALVRSLWGLSMFLFAWEFPRRTPWQERNGWIWRGMVGLMGVFAAASMGMDAAQKWGDAANWSGFIDGIELVAGFGQLAAMLAIGGFFALLWYKRFALSDVESVRRLRTIIVGAMVALTPLFLLLLYSLILRKGLDPKTNWLVAPSFLAMGVFPITLAYVIVVHRAFGISMVIRQGLQYALAQRGVRVLQALLILGVISTAVVMAVQPGMNRPRILQVVGLGTLAVVSLQRGAEMLSKWVDRRFFRESYNAELVLTSLSEDVRTMVETRPLLEAVATRIGEALHVERIALLLREGGQFQPAYALGLGAGGGAPLPETARTAEVMRRERGPLRVYLDDATSWVYREGLSKDETAWLGATGVELLLPLAVKDKLLGFVSLGRKKSEEPYSGNDLRLLQSVALQTGLALENSQLAAAITEATAQRERLNRELEIAHEVQERLFPQNLPEIPGLDFWGYCRPAKGVGGDSYDFLLLENGHFAISIGDVSGKGIPAALLMASLQSALRGQAMSLPPDLGTMIGNMNRLIYDSSPSNRYATLFYSQFDPATRVLTYVNGGHCPPMILRGSEIYRLEDGGPVVGLFRPGRFVQGTFQVQNGDVLVGFTDGISEAMNAADEEWGEDALGAFLQTCAGDTAREMIPKIVAAADRFADGFPQHDDMTLIVVRFLG